jgi:hypothetical protein
MAKGKWKIEFGTYGEGNIDNDKYYPQNTPIDAEDLSRKDDKDLKEIGHEFDLWIWGLRFGWGLFNETTTRKLTSNPFDLECRGS